MKRKDEKCSNVKEIIHVFLSGWWCYQVVLVFSFHWLHLKAWCNGFMSIFIVWRVHSFQLCSVHLWWRSLPVQLKICMRLNIKKKNSLGLNGKKNWHGIHRHSSSIIWWLLSLPLAENCIGLKTFLLGMVFLWSPEVWSLMGLVRTHPSAMNFSEHRLPFPLEYF